LPCVWCNGTCRVFLRLSERVSKYIFYISMCNEPAFREWIKTNGAAPKAVTRFDFRSKTKHAHVMRPNWGRHVLALPQGPSPCTLPGTAGVLYFFFQCATMTFYKCLVAPNLNRKKNYRCIKKRPLEGSNPSDSLPKH
jgi:hypothetical protein